jgi:fluoroquinolone transport system ATP-binding protein
MIEVENLKFKYKNESNYALKGVSFKISKGEVFGFLGPSGSGKSTTQKILFNLLRDYEGSAKMNHIELKDWGRDLYQKIGVGFELPNHYLKLSALENLNFFAAFYENTLNPMNLLERVGLDKDANKKVGEFSKGMKMRLNFVRAVMHQPEMLFLDEPTSGLDPSNAKVIKDWILDLKKEGKTIFITTHQMHDADELCDQIAFLAEGEIKALDSPQNLKMKYSKNNLNVNLINGEIHSFELNNIGQNADFLQLISNNPIQSMHSEEANLDEVFIKVTGKSLL